MFQAWFSSTEIFFGFSALLFFSFCVYKFIFCPAFASPLAGIPSAHPTAAFSSLWILWMRYRGREYMSVHEAHLRKGPLIRVSPTEVSVNCYEGGVKTVYFGGFEKHACYEVFSNYGYHNLFSTVSSRTHGYMKRKVASMYSKAYVVDSAEFQLACQEIIMRRMAGVLDTAAGAMMPLDIYSLFLGTAIDMASAWLFGLEAGTNFVVDVPAREHWLKTFHASIKHLFWEQQLPKLIYTLRRLGIVSLETSRRAKIEIEQWCLNMMSKLELRTTKSSISTAEGLVYRSLMSTKTYQSTGSTAARLQVASELLDHLLAGHDTIATGLTYLIYELSRNPDIRHQLQQELRGLGDFHAATLPAPRDVDKLPLLHACILETLRLHPPSPGPKPRTTPTQNSTILGHEMPPLTTISAQAYSLHRNAEVFPEPESWLPSRWLPDPNEDKNDEGTGRFRTREMERWFWPFGSGARMCLAREFAMLEMKMVVAVVCRGRWRFVVDVAPQDMVQAASGEPVCGGMMATVERDGK